MFAFIKVDLIFPSNDCSVIGGALMVGGLYTVLWGKSREQKDSKANAEVGK